MVDDWIHFLYKHFFRYNYEGKYLDTDELAEFLREEEAVSVQ